VTKKKQQVDEGAQVNATNLQPFNPSDELQTLLEKLSPAQAEGVIRIVQVESAGGSIESLFAGPEKICSHSTFYHKARGGWIHKTAFQAALALTRREMRAQRLGSVVEEAIEELKLTTPLAAADLRRQITGDEPAVETLKTVLLNGRASSFDRLAAATGLGQIGTRAATDALMQTLAQVQGGLSTAIIEALGQSGIGVNVQRRMASIAVLDRADRQTASKGLGAESGEDLNDAREQLAGRLAELATRGPADAASGKPE